ncbi:MAG: DNA polymerase domain-containing protein [Parcubacteria group bacterium]
MRRLVTNGQKERQVRIDAIVDLPNQTTIAPDVPPVRGLLNVAQNKDNIIIVERNGDEVIVRERAAEFSCFIRNDIDDETKRKIRNHRAVKGMLEEGDWIRILWKSSFEREDLCKKLEADGVRTYEGDVGAVRRFLTDHKIPHVTPRLCYYDIETDSRVPVRLAAEGKARILCWSVIGADGKVTVGVLDDDTDTAERALLQRLIKTLEQYDQVASWNGDNFDFPATKARCAQRRISVNFDRWLWLDQMDLFIRMNTMAAESGEEKASYSLQAISMALLGVGKDDIDASRTYEYWAAGGEERQKLVRYNVTDVKRQRGIEEKTGYIALLQTLAETTNVFPDSRGMNPTIQAEGFLLRLGADRNYRFPSNFERGHSDRFKGAFVMEPQGSGIIKNVHVGDFASLYPSIIVTWNMSPETLIADEALAQASALDEPYCTAPITGTCFLTREEGILPHAVKEVMRLRKYWNDLKASYPPGSDEWVSANRKATAYKIAANSFYGVIGSPMSRFFSRDVAEAVTQAGAWLIQETMAAAEARTMHSIYGDTDSLFIGNCTRTQFEVFVEWCNHDFYPVKLKDLGCKENLIKLAYEKEFERIIFISAKKYVGRYVHFKGTMADASSKPEVKGLEYKRGDSIRVARNFQAEVIDLLVGMENGGHEDTETFDEVIARWQASILNDPLTIDDISMAKRLNKPLNEYARKRTKDGGWAKQLPHIELARKMIERGEDVREGTKVTYFVYDASHKGDVEYRLKEEWDGTFDRYECWEKLTWPPTQRLLEAAFPGHPWDDQYGSVRPKTPRAPRATKAKAPPKGAYTQDMTEEFSQAQQEVASGLGKRGTAKAPPVRGSALDPSPMTTPAGPGRRRRVSSAASS